MILFDPEHHFSIIIIFIFMQDFLLSYASVFSPYISGNTNWFYTEYDAFVDME